MANSRDIPVGQQWLLDRMQITGLILTSEGVCRGRTVYETLLMFENNLDTLDINRVNNTLVAASKISVEEMPTKIKELDWRRTKLVSEAIEAAFKELPEALQKKALSRQLNKEEGKQYEKAIQQKWSQAYAQLSQADRDELGIPAYLRGVNTYQTPDRNPALISQLYPEHTIKHQKPAAQELSKNLLDIVQTNALKQQGGLCEIAAFNGAYTQDELSSYFRGLRTELNTHSATAHPVAMLLNTTAHSIMVGYDPSKYAWVFNNANEKGAEYVTDEAILAQKLITGMFSTNKNVVLETTVLVSNRDAKQMHHHIEAWRNQAAMKEMHKVTVERNNIRDSYGNSLLHIAAKTGDVPTLKKLMADNVDVHETFKYPGRDFPYSALMLASQSGHNKAVDLLLSSKFAHAKEDDQIAFRFAAQNGHNNVVTTFLNHHYDPNMRARGLPDNQTPLYDAAKNGHADVVRNLLSHNADPNLGTTHGTTPLFMACVNGHGETIKELVKCPQTEVNKPNTDGETPLSAAATCGNFGAVEEMLFSKRVDVNKSANNGVSPLYKAAAEGHQPIVNALLNAGANPNLANNAGETPLFAAANNGKTSVVETLLDRKDTLSNLANNNGVTPLRAAADHQHAQTAQALVNHKTNPAIPIPGLDLANLSPNPVSTPAASAAITPPVATAAAPTAPAAPAQSQPSPAPSTTPRLGS